MVEKSGSGLIYMGMVDLLGGMIFVAMDMNTSCLVMVLKTTNSLSTD